LKTTFFSIIIPTFNSQKVLSVALQSVIRQTFTNFEVLIVDGLSTDDTLKIAQSFNDDRIKIFSERDSGIYEAMNKGIEKAAGEWLYFLGSDDKLYDDAVLTTVNKMIASNNDKDVIYGDVYSTRFGGRYDGEFNRKKIIVKNICHQAVFFKKNVFNIVGNFDIHFFSHADWDHNMKWMFSKNLNHKYIDLIIANYADGGFSSNNGDIFFSNIKDWKVAVLRKDEISFLNKLRISKNELSKAFKASRTRDFITILTDLLKFLL
jgi:glycosyltransferase involved in cell wall biosynthesis